jgi:hypothetical protein
MIELEPRRMSWVWLLLLFLFGMPGIISPLVMVLSNTEDGLTLGICAFDLLFILPTLFALYKVIQRPLQPRLFVSSEKLRPGEIERFKWTLSKGISLIKRMRIKLLGREIAKESVGSSTRVHKNTFAETLIVDTDDPKEMSEGYSEVRMPASLPAFKSRNNEVRWNIEVSLRLRGGITFKYPFTIVCLPPIPARAPDPIRPSYTGSAIKINEEHINFAPGEWVTGVVSMEEERDAELRLTWFTEGKGDKDSKIVQRKAIEDGRTTSFKFEIPADASPSFSGQLISLTWALKLVAKRRGLQLRAKELDYASLIVSPTGKEFTLS